MSLFLYRGHEIEPTHGGGYKLGIYHYNIDRHIDCRIKQLNEEREALLDSIPINYGHHARNMATLARIDTMLAELRRH
jgi:hypothetical protein